MQDLKGKKILILNGNSLSCDIVEKARQLGVYTIVTDYYKNSPAKLLADESYMVSISDTDAIVELVKKLDINGIYTQYTDSSLPYCQKACAVLGFPFFLDEWQLDHITNKSKSKQLCQKYGIPVSKRYYLSDKMTDADMKAIDNWPVLTKPVDNSGQRGITICSNPTDLRKGYQYALDNSESRQAIVEEYMRGDYVVVNLTLQNGNLTLSCLADKPVLSERYSGNMLRLPKAYIMPSKYIDLFYEKAFAKFQLMARDMGLKNGSWSIECIVRNNDFYVFEMQFRLGGMKHHNIVLKENGIDLLEMHIRYALTGVFEGYNLIDMDNPRYKHVYCSLNIILQSGVIKEISGLHSTRTLPGVISMVQMHSIGDIVEANGTVFQIFAKYSLIAKNEEELMKLIYKIHKLLSVKDNYGNDMIIIDW